MLKPTPVFHPSNLLHAGARLRSPNRSVAHSRTFDHSPAPKELRPLFPLVSSRNSVLNQSSPFAELISENPKSVLGMTTMRLNLKLSQDYGQDNRDLLGPLREDRESAYRSVSIAAKQKTFKESKMCWNYFATETDVCTLIKAKLYNQILDGQVSKPARMPLSTAPRPLIPLPAVRPRHHHSSSPRKSSEVPTLSEKMVIKGKRETGKTALLDSGVGQQTYTPTVSGEDAWTSVTEFITYTKEKYKPLFLQLAGRDRERVTRESIGQYLVNRGETESHRQMLDKSDGDTPLSDDFPPTPLPRLRPEFYPTPSPLTFEIQAAASPLHLKKPEDPPAKPQLVTSLMVHTTQKLFTDGHAEWILYEQFVAILVMFEYTWNGFPLKKKAERVHRYILGRFDPINEDLVAKMTAEVRELKKVYILLADKKTGVVKNRSLEGFLQRMRAEQREEGLYRSQLDPSHFTFFDFCMAVPFIMTDQTGVTS